MEEGRIKCELSKCRFGNMEIMSNVKTTEKKEYFQRGWVYYRNSELISNHVVLVTQCLLQYFHGGHNP
jgi:hypothetical protein